MPEGLICSLDWVARKRGFRKLPTVDDTEARGVSDFEMDDFCCGRTVELEEVGVGMTDRGKGRRDDSFGMPLSLRLVFAVAAEVAVAPGRFSSILTETRRSQGGLKRYN